MAPSATAAAVASPTLDSMLPAEWLARDSTCIMQRRSREEQQVKAGREGSSRGDAAVSRSAHLPAWHPSLRCCAPLPLPHLADGLSVHHRLDAVAPHARQAAQAGAGGGGGRRTRGCGGAVHGVSGGAGLAGGGWRMALSVHKRQGAEGNGGGGGGGGRGCIICRQGGG